MQVGPTQEFILTKFAASIIWFSGIAIWYLIRFPFERSAKKLRITRSLFDWRERGLLTIIFFVLSAFPAGYVLTGFPGFLNYSFVPALSWLGLIVLGASLWLFYRSHVYLDRNWSMSLEIREQHVLVKSGIYRLIRHPMYASFLLLGIAQALLLPNLIVGGAGLVGLAFFCALRISREEQLMTDFFGEEYRSYAATTKRIIPGII